MPVAPDVPAEAPPPSVMNVPAGGESTPDISNQSGNGFPDTEAITKPDMRNEIGGSVAAASSQ